MMSVDITLIKCYSYIPAHPVRTTPKQFLTLEHASHIICYSSGTCDTSFITRHDYWQQGTADIKSFSLIYLGIVCLLLVSSMIAYLTER